MGGNVRSSAEPVEMGVKETVWRMTLTRRWVWAQVLRHGPDELRPRLFEVRASTQM